MRTAERKQNEEKILAISLIAYINARVISSSDRTDSRSASNSAQETRVRFTAHSFLWFDLTEVNIVETAFC